MTSLNMSTALIKPFKKRAKTQILVINPNSSQSMTDGLRPAIDSLNLPSSIEIFTYTGPASSPASINDQGDIDASTEAVLSNLKSQEDGRTRQFDGALIACFSVHPLVHKIQYVDCSSGFDFTCTGIFEASILTALSLLEKDQQWGIVTTGKFWEDHLTHGVKEFIGAGNDDKNHKFAGVQSTGLNASDFHHGVDPAVVKQKLKEATQRLLRTDDGDHDRVYVVVMGCAGMAGLEDIIREAACDLSGDRLYAYQQLHVVDGVRAGIMQLDHMIQNQRLRPGGVL